MELCYIHNSKGTVRKKPVESNAFSIFFFFTPNHRPRFKYIIWDKKNLISLKSLSSVFKYFVLVIWEVIVQSIIIEWMFIVKNQKTLSQGPKVWIIMNSNKLISPEATWQKHLENGVLRGQILLYSQAIFWNSRTHM